jgi:hypothetical protein
MLQVGYVVLDKSEDRLQLRIWIKSHDLSVVCFEVHQVLSPEYLYKYHWHSSWPTTPSFSYTKLASDLCRM